ncbi:hypothetical protein CVT24_003218 [Panaeolus cyanescens]|uniref:Uncharacterized protein n=1 Tax=Panaeolus cyanescens TaxID=181874 RepID=A0A409WMJ2_9AGAR|nr:hypothetical protein CVT24_003218 [Panaeolus cyanescens]
MLYPLELFIIIILSAIQHPAKGMVVGSLVPTIGIVFVLLSVRVHFGTSFKSGATKTAASNFPDLFRESLSDGGINIERPVPGHSIDRINLVEFKTGNDRLPLQRYSYDTEDRDPCPTPSPSRRHSLTFSP